MRRFALLALAAFALLALTIEPALAKPKKPQPRLGRTVVLMATDGHPTVKPPHKKRMKLAKGEAIAVPVGSTVDATSGHVKLTSAKRYSGTQSGTFSQGAFNVTQRKSDSLTDLELVGGDFSVCTAAARANKPVVGAANKRRRLFGRAHGRFRTRGRNSSATVRGTEWLTEDRCNGTVTENKSPNTTSKVSTETQDQIHFDLDPGQTITYYCNKLRIEPDMYCVILLAQPADGLIAGGIVTQIDVPGYYLYVKAPDGQEGAVQIPLSEKDAQGFRQSIFACPVRQVGKFDVGWSLDGQNLLTPPYTLSLTLDVVGPNENCITDPPTPEPIAKRLP
jgi:hypothetical protein